MKETLRKYCAEQLDWDAMVDEGELEKEQVAEALQDTHLVLEDTHGKLEAAQTTVEHAQWVYDEVAQIHGDCTAKTRRNEIRTAKPCITGRAPATVYRSENQIVALSSASTDEEDRALA